MHPKYHSYLLLYLLQVTRDAGAMNSSNSHTLAVNDLEQSTSIHAPLTTFLPSTVSFVTGNALLRRQWRAIFTKRWLPASRYYMAVVGQILLPVVFSIAACVIAIVQKSVDQPPRSFNTGTSYVGAKAFTSARDLGSDTWSTVYERTQTAFGLQGAMPISQVLCSHIKSSLQIPFSP